jgi:two-component system sensor histidine kinase LytS
MSDRSTSLSPSVINIALSAVTAILLLLVAWGVAEGNVIASMLSGAGLAVVIVAFGTINLVPDTMRAEATERTLAIASETLRSCNHGLTPDNAAHICRLLLPETAAVGIAVTNTKKVLAYEGEHGVGTAPGSENTVPTLEVLESKRMEMGARLASSCRSSCRMSPSSSSTTAAAGHRPHAAGHCPRACGSSSRRSSRPTSWTGRQSFSARAEVKALQAQINPHFLFNTLNTIASLTRTDPTKARDLLREFAVFYRRRSRGRADCIPLSASWSRRGATSRSRRRALARTASSRPSLWSLAARASRCPRFIMQPIVENSVRHAMRDEGPLHIDIHVAVDGNDVLIAVADDGLGMDQETVAELLAAASKPSESRTGLPRGRASRSRTLPSAWSASMEPARAWRS